VAVEHHVDAVEQNDRHQNLGSQLQDLVVFGFVVTVIIILWLP
jgi:hypothetical protein